MAKKWASEHTVSINALRPLSNSAYHLLPSFIFMNLSSSLTTIASMFFFFLFFTYLNCGDAGKTEKKRKLFNMTNVVGSSSHLKKKEVGYRRRRVLSREATLNKITCPVEINSTTSSFVNTSKAREGKLFSCVSCLEGGKKERKIKKLPFLDRWKRSNAAIKHKRCK
jgi:hypothetical protein